MCPHGEVQASSAFFFFFLQEYHRRDSASFSLPPVERYVISISLQLVPATLIPLRRWRLPAFCDVMLLSLFIINVCFDSFTYLCHHGVMAYYFSQQIIIHSYHYLFFISHASKVMLKILPIIYFDPQFVLHLTSGYLPIKPLRHASPFFEHFLIHWNKML